MAAADHTRLHLARLRPALIGQGGTRDPIPTPVLSPVEGPPARCLTPADHERLARLRAALRRSHSEHTP